MAKPKKRSKSSLALVVSTPEITKGWKKKAQGEMGKEKGKKKRESYSNPIFEHDTLYFAEVETQERYDLDFSLRKVLNGRWIDYRFLDFHNF